jgi:hyperosmotically inducible protein
MRTWSRSTIQLVAILIASAAPAAGHTADGPNRVDNPEFARLDVNRDGHLSRDEVRKLANFERAFREADDNRDGRLDADEFVKAQAIHERLRAEQFLDDSVITAKVKAALLKDLRLKGLEVTVETYRGTVQLSGFVSDGEQARRAAEIAAGVEGVAAVRNSLIVKG